MFVAAFVNALSVIVDAEVQLQKTLQFFTRPAEPLPFWIFIFWNCSNKLDPKGIHGKLFSSSKNAKCEGTSIIENLLFHYLHLHLLSAPIRCSRELVDLLTNSSGKHRFLNTAQQEDYFYKKNTTCLEIQFCALICDR